MIDAMHDQSSLSLQLEFCVPPTALAFAAVAVVVFDAGISAYCADISAE